MIRINITDKDEYSRLRMGFLNRICKYVKFNKEDIVPGATLDQSTKDKMEDDLTSQTAKDLKTNFKSLYEYLFEANSDIVNRKRLQCLLAGPDEMPQSFGGCGEKQTMLECFEEIIDKVQMPEDENDQKTARECCEKIFDYDSFVKGQDEAYWLLRNLNVRVCPYCNQIYTVTLPSREELEKGEEFKTTRATFDHFYAKSKYPYLAVSLFNLVPSCGVCNLNKTDSNPKIVYPYEQEFGKDAVFRLIPVLPEEANRQNRYILNFLHGESDFFNIKFMGKNDICLQGEASLKDRLSDIENVDLRERIIKSIGTFKLEEIYKEHKQEVKDILRNRYIFSDQYIKTQICPMIKRKIRKIMEGEGEYEQISEEEIEKLARDMLYFNRLRMEEWGQRPLSKLISDVLEQSFEI